MDIASWKNYIFYKILMIICATAFNGNKCLYNVIRGTRFVDL